MIASKNDKPQTRASNILGIWTGILFMPPLRKKEETKEAYQTSNATRLYDKAIAHTLKVVLGAVAVTVPLEVLMHHKTGHFVPEYVNFPIMYAIAQVSFRVKYRSLLRQQMAAKND